MALDGDTDFHPSALILLVDRLRMYDNVGAACGRIHPTGMGKGTKTQQSNKPQKVFMIFVIVLLMYY